MRLLLAALLLSASLVQAGENVPERITAVGSDTLSELMTRWVQGFARTHPRILVQMQNPGSGSAPQALMAGASNLGPMSRAMNSAEISAFTDRFGYPPTGVRVAFDAIGLFVHAGNPLTELPIAQIDAIFSSTRWCARIPARERWSELGVGGPLSTHRIVRLGRNSASGTYEFFQSHALCGGDLRADVQQIPGSPTILRLLAGTPSGIAYASAGTPIPGVRALSLRTNSGSFAPTERDVMEGRYPLTRPLFLYVNRAPGHALAPSIDAFLRYALSVEGQAVAAATGYFPLDERQLESELARLTSD